MECKIKRPQKAPSTSITGEQLRDTKIINYPVVGSPKIDGIRAICTGEIVLSNTLKPIGNKHIQACLSNPDYADLDGELVVGKPYIENEEDDVFNRTTGAVRRADGKPDFKFYVFDDFGYPNLNYQERWLDVKDSIELPFVVVVEQRLLYSAEEVEAFEEEMVNLGYEGAMIRSPLKKYKEGRCTLLEGNIFKRAPFADDEAVVLSCYEQQENTNEKKTNELGLTTRSSHQENKIGKDTLGGFVCKSMKFKESFHIGTIKGGKKEWRKKIWEQWKLDPDSIRGLIMKYKYKDIGTIDLPRQPIGKGFRDPSDITNY
jgi:DNA ligase-1